MNIPGVCVREGEKQKFLFTLSKHIVCQVVICSIEKIKQEKIRQSAKLSGEGGALKSRISPDAFEISIDICNLIYLLAVMVMGK